MKKNKNVLENQKSESENLNNQNQIVLNRGMNQLTEIQYQMEQLNNRMAGVERVKSQNWLDTNQKIDSIGQRMIEQERALNDRVKEVRNGIFASFTKEQLEKDRRQTVKISILETQHRDITKLLTELEKRLEKANNRKEM